MLAIIAGILTPIAAKLINAYITPKLLPVIDKVSEVESKLGHLDNDIKHSKILTLIETTPKIMKFVNKCGWNPYQLDVVIKFCVLLAKKPPTERANRDKWNDDDLKTLFDFSMIIIGKWIDTFSKKRSK
jgi:hypothetical protein